MESIGKLHVKKNGAIVSSFELESGENIIGRPSKEKPSTIEIEGDDKLSRQHFIIKVNQNEDGTFKYLLRDNDSLNGTQTISGKKKKTLSNSEEIQLLNKDCIIAGEKLIFEVEIPTSECETPTGKIQKQVTGKISVPMTVAGKTEYKMIDPKQILYIEADGNYAYVYVINDKNLRCIWTTQSLAHFIRSLKDEPYMLQIHAKYVVNMDMIKDYWREGKDGTILLDVDKDDIKIILEKNEKLQDEKNIEKKQEEIKKQLKTHLIVSRTYKSSFEEMCIPSKN